MFHSTTISFPEDLLVLGKYLGPSIDIGPTMTAKILTPTGKVVHRSTYRQLTPEEFAYPVEEDCMKAFLQTAEERWGNHLARGQLEGVGLIGTPDTQPYLDNQHTNKTFPPSRRKSPPRLQTSIFRHLS